MRAKKYAAMLELVLLLHFAFVIYIVAGFAWGVAVNHRLFRLVHAGALAVVTSLMVAGLPCPLTVLEERMSLSSYEGSFIAWWLNRILYMQGVDPRAVFLADLAFAALVASSFWWRPLPPARKNGGSR